METIHSINLIATNPKVRSGRAIIAGTTICVSDVVMIMRFQHHDPDELAAWFNLPPESIYAALAYYYQHKAALDEEIRQRLKLADELTEKMLNDRRPLLSR